MTAPPPVVSVRGGSAGVVADCAELVALAGRFGEVARETLATALALHGCLAGPALGFSAVLDPVGHALFEAELLAALDGWRGLGAAGAACGGLDLQLRLAAAAYEHADRLATGVHDALLGGIRSTPALASGGLSLARTGDPVRAAQAVVAADPELADLLVCVLGVPALLRRIGGSVPDGHGVAQARGLDRGAGRPPRRLADLLDALARRNTGAHGEIDVRILTLADGSRRAIVDITGTKSWDPRPTSDVTSLTTNGHALVGDRTAYEDGVLAALRRSGVRPGDPVMLVGHSQGGMVAVTAARDAVASGEFDVTHVVTAGSPVGLTVGALPARVQVLALENSRDVVPHLDGAANPDRPNVTTVSGRTGDGSVLGDHDINGAYTPLAVAAQAAGNRSVRDFLAGAGGFFRARTVQTHVYQVRRRY